MTDNKTISTKTKRKNRREIETLLIIALAACMISFSILLLFAVLMGQSIHSWNNMAAVGAFFGVTGVIWGILVLINN